MTTTSPLRGLLRQPLWRRWTLASFLARLPNTMTLIALVLVGEAVTGSLAIGIQLSGVAIATSGLAATWRGRRLDRFELRAGLQRACCMTSGVMAAQAIALVLGAPVWAFFALAVVQGVAFAAISGGFRALLVPVVPSADLPRANALEAVFVEVAFVAGPGVAALLGLLIGPLGVLIVMSASLAGAALVSGGLPTLDPPPERSPAKPWRTAGAWQVYVLAIAVGLCLGVLESAIPARAVELGLQTASGGFLLTFIAAGSGVGGVAAALAREPLGRARLRAAGFLVALGILIVPAALTDSLVLLGVALLLCGVPIAPMNALAAMLLQRTVPAGRQAEGFAVFIAAILLGAGAGQVLTGQLLDDVGAQVMLGVSAGLPLLTALLLLGPGFLRSFGLPDDTSTGPPGIGHSVGRG